jgi:hypothetical protein
MAQIESTFIRDANRIPIWTDGLVATKTITYVAATTGAVGASNLFTVSGDVIVNVFAVCSVDLTGSGTVEVGITGNTASLIAQTTGTAIDAGEVWVDNAPATVESLPTAKLLTNGTDIIQTIATNTITAGTITYYCLWRPLSSSSNVVAA